MPDVQIRHIANIRGQAGAKGEKGDPGTIASVSIVLEPAGTPASVIMSGPETARHAEFHIPAGAPGAGQEVTDAAIAGNLYSTATSSGQGFQKRVGYRVSVLAHGAVADGVTDDFTAFTAAKSEAGTKGVVWFPAKPGAVETVYMLSPAARRSLAGTRIELDPGVVLKGRFEADVKDWNLLTDAVIDNTEHVVKTTKPRKRPADPSAAAAAIVPDNAAPTALDYTSSAFTPEGFGGGFAPYTPVANGLARTASEITWPTGFGGAGGYEGIMATPIFGHLYEATIQASQNNSAAFNGMAVISTDNFLAGFRNAPGSSTWAGFGSTAFMAAGSVAETGLYASHVNGVTLGIRVVDARTVEFFVNGKRIFRRKTLKDIAKIAWVITSSDATGKKLQWPVSYGPDYRPPATHRIGSCSIIGDSIPYGAWVTTTFADLLPVALAGLPNGGHITVRQNLAISGSKAQDWAPGGIYDIGTQSFVGDRYVLVMLGTNDGATRDVTAYLNDLDAIASKIKADGAIPIFAVFPFWSNSALSGVTGVPTASPSAVQRLRAALTYWASSTANGYELAFVNHTFGDIFEWLGDNIHPTEFGQAAIARAFANAIARAELRRITA